MRRLFIVLGFIAAVLALILSVTPLSQIGYLPAIAAIVFGIAAFYLSKKKQLPRKSVHLIFLLTLISLSVSTYKKVFQASEVANMEEFEKKEEASMEDSKEILENLDLEGIEDMEIDMDTSDLELLEEEDFPDLSGLEEK